MQLRSLILPIAVLISLILYYPTHNYGLVTDYLGWLNKYRAGDWGDIVHCFNYPGLHQFFHLINFTIYKITNADTFSLYLIFAISHGLVSYSVYRALRKIGEWFEWELSGIGAFFAALMFLLSPYSIEAVTWKACYHYLMITAMVSIGIILFIKYLESNQNKYLLGHFMIFILSLFTIELSLVTPGIYGFLYLTKFYQNRDRIVLKKGIYINIIHAAFLIFYFILTKWMIGDYIGHYGAEQHMDFTPSLILTTASKYFVKYIGFTHYLSFQPRYELYGFLSQTIVALAVLLPLILAILLGYKNKKNSAGLVIGFSFICFIIALLPVLNLYFMNLHHYENDRYGYFASIFFYFGLTALLLTFGGRLKYSLCLIFIVICIYFGQHTIHKVQIAGDNIRGLINNFEWYDEQAIVIGGLPENLDGIYMFRDFSDEGVALKESLDWHRRKPYSGNIKVLSKYNMKNNDAHLDMKFIGKDSVQVWDMMPGSWFWRKGVGMGSYSNNGARIDMKEGYFNATFDEKMDSTLFIYPSGSNWTVLD